MSEDDLLKIFSEAGEVSSVKIIRKMNSGFSRGFAFIEMRSEASAMLAIQKFDGKDLDGRVIRVSDATPKIIKQSTVS